MDPRVEDFLNDKIQAYTDFESLDILLAELSSQQEKLRDQLDTAETERRSLGENIQSGLADVERDVASYVHAQETIEQRMASIANATELSVAAEAIAAPMESQRSLWTAGEYLRTLIQFDDFGYARKQSSQSKDAIAVANEAFAISAEVKARHARTYDAAPHLVDCIEQATTAIRKSVEEDLAKQLRGVAEKFLWPKPDIQLTESIVAKLHAAVDKLLQLQTPEIEVAESKGRSHDLYQPVVLTPFKILIEPLALRFAYHFSGNKPTNRLDKPQYYLSHATEIMNTYAEFFTTYLQPILLKRFAANSHLNGFSYIDSTTALINAILPMVDSKLEQTIVAAAADPRLLSHLIHEVIQFDLVLRNEWRYEPAPTDASNECRRWRGIADALLTDGGTFQQWLNAERELALARYEGIVADSTGSLLDLDAADSSCTKPTKAAVKIQDLVGGITYHFRDLPSLSMRLRFLIDIQIAILDRFYSRLESSLEAYVALTSTIGRVMQSGASQEADVRGINGLERLIRVCGSADYFEQSMKSWSDETFFLELWDELQAKAKTGEKIGKNLDVSDLAKQTSSSLVDSPDAGDVETGAVFDESAAAYKSLRLRAESLVTAAVCNAAMEGLTSYMRSVSSWSLATGSGKASNISSDLGHYLRVTVPELTFLVRVMSRSAATKVLRAWSRVFEGACIDSVIYKNTFTAEGVEQLNLDINAVYDAVSAAAAPYGLSVPKSPKLLEALTLLNLGTTHGASEGATSSAAIERMLFADGETARKALEHLDIEAISPREARRILGARAHAASAD